MPSKVGSVFRKLRVLLVALAAPAALAQPNLNGLIDILSATPEGSWVQVNLNSFSEVWTPPELRPLQLQSNPEPSRIVEAWSSFAWDSKRGDLILYGGGHANYSGNDVYRWRGTTQLWERASLPSQIVLQPNGFHTAIDGVDAAPSSAHTYDNNLYLPIIDRFITFGGAAYNTGHGYKRPITSSTEILTGPYLWDPDKADGTKVGGTTGSHVKRVAPYPGIVGGNMWTNRDVHLNDVVGTPPGSHVNGMTAYAQENGKDVVYVAARPGQGTNLTLYRYVINQLDDVTLDSWDVVGTYWSGPSDQGSAAHDPVRRLFVRSGTQSLPIIYWDLDPSRLDSRDKVVIPTDLSGGFDFSRMRLAGLDFDPVIGAFMLWYGGGDVWLLDPPTPLSTTGWTLQRASVPQGAVPSMDVATGVLGKFKYIPNLDAFMALQDGTNGNVWLFKPLGWQTPGLNPTVSITSPASGASFPLAASVTIEATASDADGIVVGVAFYVDGVLVGNDAVAPYSITVSNPAPGSHVLTALATDNVGRTTMSAPVSITVGNVPPTVGITSPAEGATFTVGIAVAVDASAADSDGSVSRVDFYSGAVLVGTDTTAPYSVSLSGLTVASHVLTAVATDNAGATTASAPVTISVVAGGGGTVTLQDGLSGYGGTRDAYLSSWSVNQNYGSATTLLNGTPYVDLVRFAIFVSEGGPVPNGATITSAQLSLYKTTSYSYTYEARRMLVDWVEAESTWNRPRVGATWAVAGAGGAGVDYAAAADATATIGWDPGWLVFDVTAGVQALSGGQANRGWRLLGVSGNNNEKRFASSEHPTQSLRPMLTVAYVIGSNAPPTVAITSPGDGAILAAGSSVAVSANASDSDGTIARVDFYRNGVLVGSDSSAPYAATASVAAGSQVFTAIAIDNLGVTMTSAGVSVVGNLPPTVAIGSPANGAVYAVGAQVTVSASASDGDGSVIQVDFYRDGSLVGSDSAAPYGITLSATAGTHQLTAVATDNRGATTTSAAVSIVGNVPPTVGITSPAEGATFTAGVAVAVDASAADSDGSVSRVDFYSDGVLVGTDTTAPYSVSLSGLTVASHVLTAVATDNAGATTASAPVTISVVAGGGGTVTLQDGLSGYGGTRDAYLSSWSVNQNYGSATTLLNGTPYVDLVRFAIFVSEGGPVPNGATITSAQLSLYKTTSYSYTYEARRMLVDWVEAESTWNRPRVGATWAVAGAGGAGVDYAAAADATATIGWDPGWLVFDVTAGVQALSGGQANRGWRLLGVSGNNNEKRFASSEHPTQSLRPKLTIAYTP